MGWIDHEGERIKFPQSLTLSRADGYEWDALITHVVLSEQSSNNSMVLNPNTLNQYLVQYVCREQKMYTKPGIIEEHKGQTLYLELTRDLNEDTWAMLLVACQLYDVHLQVHCSYTPILPDAFKQCLSPVTKLESLVQRITLDNLMIDRDTVIVSNDTDVIIHQLKKKQPEAWVFDVTECQPSDLLYQMDANVIQSNDQFGFEFAEHRRALVNALNENQVVILTGKITRQLMDALMPLWFERQVSQPRGRLIIATEDDENCAHLLRVRVEVGVYEKRNCLEECPDWLQPYLEQDSLARLEARLAFSRRYPLANSDNAWLGFESLPMTRVNSGLGLDTSAQEAKGIEAYRLQQVKSVLSTSPYVYLTGLTGVGKTTFVRKLLSQFYTPYYGEEKLKDWVNDKSGKACFLFIDEANITPKQWSLFEGLFQNPPMLLIDGEVYPLDEYHKVVFAGNPLNYGDERTLCSFFLRHGNAVVFEPMSSAYIYECALKPIFKNTPWENSAFSICRHFFEVYRFLCEHAVDEILISPRELEMMALLFISQCETDADNFAQQIAYDVACHIVPDSLKVAFDQKFAPKPKSNDVYDMTTREKFVVTPSRHSAVVALEQRLALRAFKRHRATEDAQRQGVLNALVFEGEPGVGKSELVYNVLKAAGFQAGDENKDNCFYTIPPGLGLSEKKARLLKAFNEGAVVIMEEMNSSPMMERMLNALLMGRTEDGELPSHYGFMVIGTQNPISMAGRRDASTALKCRMTLMEIPPYSSEEMRDILRYLKVPDAHAESAIKAYQMTSSESVTFRDVLRLVGCHVAAQQALSSEADHLPLTKVDGDEVREDSESEASDAIKQPRKQLTKLQQQLIDNLKRYTQKIETVCKQPNSRVLNFEKGFKYHAVSRGINRKINYGFAQLLINKVTETDNEDELRTMFQRSKLKQAREVYVSDIKENNSENYRRRGMNSFHLGLMFQRNRSKLNKLSRPQSSGKTARK